MATFFVCNYQVSLSFKVLEPAAGDRFHAFELRYFADYIMGLGKDCVSRHYPRHLKLLSEAGEPLPASHFLASHSSDRVKERLARKNQAGMISSGVI